MESMVWYMPTVSFDLELSLCSKSQKPPKLIMAYESS